MRCVELTGDRADLSELALSMANLNPSVSEVDGKFILRSETFQNLCDARAVLDKAKEIVSALCSLTRFALKTTSLKDFLRW